MASARLQRSLRATFIGMVVNVFLATGKLVAGVAGHSHALVADAVESFADIFSSLIVWRGVVIAAKPADADHPYGHGKAEPIAAAVVSLMLLLAAGWIAVKSVQEISAPHLAPAPFTLVVLIAVIVIKESLFRFALRTASEIDSVVVRSDAWHHRSDAITSLAAGIGITVSLIGGKGFESADDWAALVAAGVIAFNGLSLLRPALNELMDRAPEHGVTESINALARSVPGVDAVEKAHVRKMGYQLFVDMHIEVDPNMTVLRSHEIAHQVKDKIRAAMPNVSDVLVHIEPLNIPAKKTSA